MREGVIIKTNPVVRDERLDLVYIKILAGSVVGVVHQILWVLLIMELVVAWVLWW